MKIVSTKSIPNVDDQRLVDDLARLHDMLHTIEGLAAFDMPRRSLVDLGVKAHKIAAELLRRGHQPPDCRFCSRDNVYPPTNHPEGG